MSQPNYICIHGHFYQPPRENPWLESVEVQDSAAPFHDWNERITVECYGPNTAARISTWDGAILDLQSNFQKISFNFGPTLLQWLEINRPEVYEDIIEADRVSLLQRGGHGNAVAQCYNHTIMPLASDRERSIQVHWGLEDFRERFGRDPEGMWLPECAVDVKSLDELAANGVKYTILAPRQARKFRLLGTNGDWLHCDGGRIDPTRPYLCTLPSGRTINLFFYDGPISQAVAFEGLLNDGNHFAARLMQGFSSERAWPQLMHIATDGESYGHHHRRGEMALAYAVKVIERDPRVALTNYGQYLALHPPQAEVQIWNNSSWSCVHGVERWRSNCGCNSGMHGDWHQKWRGPVRDAYRVIANHADAVYTEESNKYFMDPEEALRDYIHVILAQRPDAMEAFFQNHCHPPLDEDIATQSLRLLEMMRNAQLMFTSCAWFFDEVSGLETVQTMKYAARVLQLLRPYRQRLEAEFLAQLAKAPSNIPELKNGGEVYERFVKPNIVDLHRVIAHHSLTSFDRAEEGFQRVFCYELHERDSVISSINGATMKLCRIGARSLIDREECETTVIVLHFGGHDFRASLTGPMSFVIYEETKKRFLDIFQRRSLTDLVRHIDETFGRNYYSLEHVFSEGRRELLQRITTEAFQRFDNSIRHIFEENRKFMDYLIEAGAPLPPGFISAADFVLKTRLVQELDLFLACGDASSLQETARECLRYRVRLHDPHVIAKLEKTAERLFHDLALAPTTANCRVALLLIEVLKQLDLRIDHWEAENIVFALIHDRPLPAHLERRVHREHGAHAVKAAELYEIAQHLRINYTVGSRSSTTVQRLSSDGLAAIPH